jgi:hypothetical protein
MRCGEVLVYQHDVCFPSSTEQGVCIYPAAHMIANYPLPNTHTHAHTHTQVGTSLCLPEENEPTKGRILVLQYVDNKVRD